MKHQHHGLRKTRLYRIWANIKTRCYNESDPHYERWGGRGIIVCDEWKTNFKAFYDWAMNNGYSEKLTIDRIDNDGDYEPSNCRWVTVGFQNSNKRNVTLLSYNGETHSLGGWATVLHLGHDTVRQRYRKGWPTTECLFGRG